MRACCARHGTAGDNCGRSLCDVQFAPLPLPPIQAAAVGREGGGGGADSTSHMPGKHELKGPSLFACVSV